jgi:hypothetical protein
MQNLLFYKKVNHKKIIISDEEEQEFKEAKICYMCNKPFEEAVDSKGVAD